MFVVSKNILRFKWFILLGLSCLFFILVLIFFAIPTLLSANAKKIETEALLISNQNLRTKISILDSLNLLDLEEKYRLVNVGILQNKNPFVVLAVFDEIMAKIDPANLTLGPISYSVGEIKEKQLKIADLAFTQTLKGKRESVNEFVKLTEEGYPLMTIKSIQGKYLESSSMQVDFILHVYPEIEQIPSLQTSINAFTFDDQKRFDQIIPFAEILKDQNAGSSEIQKSGKTNPFVE
jgi:hypothetical protein